MERFKALPQQQIGTIALSMFWIPTVIAILIVAFLVARTPQAAVTSTLAAVAESELGLQAPEPEPPAPVQARPDVTTSREVVRESPASRAADDSVTDIEAIDPVGAGHDAPR